MVGGIHQKVQFDNYFHLVHRVGTGIQAICVFAPQGELIAQDKRASVEAVKALKDFASRHLQGVRTTARGITRARLADRWIIHVICLCDGFDNPLASLVILTDNQTLRLRKKDLKPFYDALNALAGCLQAELRLLSELEGMAAELTERYEELNLIYESDTHSHNVYQGQESLYQLIENCTNYLDVGVTALLLNDNDNTLYNFNSARPIQNAHRVLPSLRSDLFQWIKQNNQPVVINQLTDPLRLRICPEIPYKLLACPVVSGESVIIGMLVIVNHVDKPDFTNSVRKLMEVLANRVANIIQINFDSLTGLDNLYSFEWSVKQALSETLLKGTQHAVLNVDMDGLGIINDIHGRTAGDALIFKIGEIIRKMTRSGDVVARMGGDEFGVLLENCTIETAAYLAKSIRDEVSSTTFEWQGEAHEMSVTIGVAPITIDSESVADILSAVEVARSAARERGRNRIHVFKQNDIDLLRRRDEMQWVGRIQAALRENRFLLYGQLIQPLRPEVGLSHYEVLLRILGEDGKQVIPPGVFMPAAEHYHLMPSIDRWVIEHTFQMLAQRWVVDLEIPCHVSINLSGQSLSDLDLQQYIIDSLEHNKIPPEHICFEVTESAAIANLEEAKHFIAAIKQKGCRFSLDDFGTGLSSFSYLQNLNVDYLKIDGSFVRVIDKDPIARTMVSAINQVGHAMGLQTIAEYVENETIRDHLQRMQVDFGQGYALGKPEPLQKILESSIAPGKTAAG